MNKRILSGILITIFSLTLILLGLKNTIALYYGIPLLIIGIIIIFNNKEDKIEKIK